MVDTRDRLDFEFEDAIPFSPPVVNKRKKLINLDDLLEDHLKEKKKLNESKRKKRKIQKACDEEDEVDDAAEVRLTECVDKCQKEINQINGDEELRFWGIHVFGKQVNLPLQDYPELHKSVLLQSFMKHRISFLAEIKIEGKNFIEELLINGWLLHLVRATACIEKPIATWTFNLLLYSPKVRLMEAAYELWCAILSLKNKSDESIKSEWWPKFSDLKAALLAYGYLQDSYANISTNAALVHPNCDAEGPPQNIRSWIKWATFCCKIRNSSSIFSTEEAEELLVIFVSFLLDRQLLGLSMILHEAMLSVINFFQDEEWPNSCKKMSMSLSYRFPCDINCMRVVESIVGVDKRSNQLRSAIAFQFLVTSLNEEACDAEEILQMLVAVNVKDKNCDLFKMYIYLTLGENWLLFGQPFKGKPELHELWGVCLRNCSCGITITDLRPYASHVRSKASYLLQGNTS